MNTWTLPELVWNLREAFAGFLGVDPSAIDPDRSVKELGMDSLTATELVVSIEEKLGVSLFLNDFTGQETIAGLASSFLSGRAS